MGSKSYNLVMEERKKLTETIVSNLEKDGLNWIKGWSSNFTPHNATTEKAYKGGNKFKLMVTANEKGFDDPRWITFNQAKELLEKNSYFFNCIISKNTVKKIHD